MARTRRELGTLFVGARDDRAAQPMKLFGWLGLIGGLTTFLFLRDEMAALLFWIGLGMLIHAHSPWKDFPLWESFRAAKRPFRLSPFSILSGGLVFWTAHMTQSWFIRDLFRPLGVLLTVLGIASLLAVVLPWAAQR